MDVSPPIFPCRRVALDAPCEDPRSLAMTWIDSREAEHWALISGTSLASDIHAWVAHEVLMRNQSRGLMKSNSIDGEFISYCLELITSQRVSQERDFVRETKLLGLWIYLRMRLMKCFYSMQKKWTLRYWMIGQIWKSLIPKEWVLKEINQKMALSVIFTLQIYAKTRKCERAPTTPLAHGGRYSTIRIDSFQWQIAR